MLRFSLFILPLLVTPAWTRWGALPQKTPTPELSELRLYRMLTKTRIMRKVPAQIRAHTCGRAESPNRFLGPKPKLAGTAEAPLADPALRAPAKTVDRIFKLLRASQTGRRLLSRFTPKYGYRFKIKPITNEVRKQFPAQATILAAYDPDQSTLYFDASQELGRVSYVLAHEMVHALDTGADRALETQRRYQYRTATRLKRLVRKTSQRKRRTPSSLKLRDYAPEELSTLIRELQTLEELKDIRSFRMERLAYDVSYRIWKELSALYPRYYSGAQSPKAHSHADVIQLSGLHPQRIQKFLDGHCERFRVELLDR